MAAIRSFFLLPLCLVAGSNYVGPVMPPPTKVRCPDGWSYWNNHCYYFGIDTLTWDAARATCQANLGSDLASITSEDENTFINGVFGSYWVNAWVGLHDDDDGNDWHWVDGAGIEYTNWMDSEPNNSDGKEHCGEIQSIDLLYPGKWNDMPCDLLKHNGYICKTTVKTCPEGWTYHDGKCYYASNSEATWHEARDKCKEFNAEAELVSIHSEGENNFFGDVMAHASQGTWIGMHFDNNSNTWGWSDGQDFTYDNWNNGEPNNLEVEWCAEVIDYPGSDTHAKWNNLDCTNARAFGCEFFPTHLIGCEDDWVSFEGYCYWFSNSPDLIMLGFDDARTDCQAKGGDLISIHSPEENSFVYSMEEYYGRTWIGMNNYGHPGTYAWVDGTDVTYTQWEQIWPSSTWTSMPSCIVHSESYPEKGNSWIADNCDTSHFYVCKKPVESRPINPPSTECKDCWQRQIKEKEIQERRTKRSATRFRSWSESRFGSRFHSRFDGGQQLPAGSHSHIHDILPLPVRTTPAPSIKEVTGFNPQHTIPTFTLSSGLGTTPAPPPPSVTPVPPVTTGGHGIGSSKGTTSHASTPPPSSTAGMVAADTSTPDTTTSTTTNPTTKWSILRPTTTTSSTPEPTTTTPRPVTTPRTTTTPRPTTTLRPTTSKPTTTIKPITTTKPITPRSTTTPADIGCRMDDLAYKGSCYNFPGLTNSWQEAKVACEDNNAHLVVLNDRYESAFLSSHLGELGEKSWIGMSGIINEDESGAFFSIKFTWVTRDPVTFANWDEFEPDPTHGTCVAASGHKMSSGLWSIRSCDDVLHYICEYGRRGYIPVTPPPTTPAPPVCFDGWEHKDTSCYKVFGTYMTWGRAEATCTSYGAHLASVASAEEETTLQGLSGLLELGGDVQYVWVGMSLGSGEGYQWTDGTSMAYVNWENGEPDSHLNRESCVQVLRPNFQMSDTVCDTFHPFICEAAQGTMVSTQAPPTAPPAVPCEDDPSWLLFQDYCYKFISQADDQPQTWWESHRLCRNIGGELASVHSLTENYWILSQLYNHSDNSFWLGGRAKYEGQYEWLDDSPFDFMNWAKGEPNDYLDQEDCIAMWDSGYWNDQNCGHTGGRICKRAQHATHAPPQTTTPPDGHCEADWLHFTNKCIKVFANKMVFDEARTNCKNLGGDLISIHSALEQAYLTTALGELQENTWIGLRNEQGFHWSDQSPVTYTNWAHGEPNGQEMGIWVEGEDCVELLTYNRLGRWNDAPCYKYNSYVCQRDLDTGLGTHNPPPTCSEPYANYVNYSGACYRGDRTARTWKEAEDECLKEGTHLMSVQGVAESAFVWVMMQEYGLEDIWIGLNNLEEKDKFAWSDGWPTIFTDWDLGQPNSSLADHNCVRASVASEGKWLSEPCNQKRGYFCKYTNATVPTPEPPSTGTCPDHRWLDFNGGYCYLVVKEPKPWNDANMNCLQEDAQMVSIHSKAEMELLNMATHQFVDPLWIGLVQKSEGFGWSDGTGLDFINWQDGEPNSESEQCAEFYTGTGFWNDAQCSNTRAFVCKVEKKQHDELSNPPSAEPHQHSTWGPIYHQNSLNAGGIVGIVIAVLFVVAVVGFVGVTYMKRKPAPVAGNGAFSFDNALYSERYDSGGSVSLESPSIGIEA